MKYEVVIGLEVHTELRTKTKQFSAAVKLLLAQIPIQMYVLYVLGFPVCFLS